LLFFYVPFGVKDFGKESSLDFSSFEAAPGFRVMNGCFFSSCTFGTEQGTLFCADFIFESDLNF
jgi:hypothetical protein